MIVAMILIGFINKQADIWVAGVYYLVVSVVMVIVLAGISRYVPWYVLPIVIIGVIMLNALNAILQFMSIGKLTQDNFVTLVHDLLEQLHLLKR